MFGEGVENQSSQNLQMSTEGSLSGRKWGMEVELSF